MTRSELKKRIKWAEGLDPTREDGLLTTELLNTAINDAIRQCAGDLNLLPCEGAFALRANQYKYPLPTDVLRIRRVWFIDSENVYQPLTYLNQDQFYDRFESDDTDTEPDYYSIGNYQGVVFEFWKDSVPLYDFVSSSVTTTASVRTVIDSAVSFGRTRTGRRIEPNCIVHNTTDGSYGVVESLDITTAKTTGTATSGTSTNTLEDTGKNFTALDVSVGDIICTPSSGVVTSYAFVTDVGTTTLTYDSIQGSAKRFKATDTYKVGTATEIRLSTTAPNYGLRNGADNTFAVGDAYQIEDKWRDERCILLAPTPSSSDTVGAESMFMTYSACPQLPDEDDDIIEIPDQYFECLYKCSAWQVGKLSSKYGDSEIEMRQQVYEKEIHKQKGDVYKPPISEPVNVWGNRRFKYGRGDRKDSTVTGYAYDLSKII